MPLHKTKILYRQVDEMRRVGVIEPSTSPYSSPPVLVTREGKEPRFCVDYRLLNEKTVSESSALPKIHEALKSFASNPRRNTSTKLGTSQLQK